MKKLFSLYSLLIVLLAMPLQEIWADEEPDYFTITNTHASYTMTVKMTRTHNTNSPTAKLEVRTVSAAGVASSWSTKNITGTSAITLGTIAKGGESMQIRGNNPNGFNSKTSDSYTVYFTFTPQTGTAATANLSGDIMSLIAYDSETNTINDDMQLPDYCFYNVFKYALSYIKNSENLRLPATNLSKYCYGAMFYGAVNMITCPKELPATVLPEGCYKQMFYNNNKVNYTKAPDIKATTYGGTSIQTLSDNAMFYAQSSNPNKLNYIRVYRTTWNTSYSSNWVQGVQTTAGSFYCPPQLTRTRGNSYIPNNWKVYSYDLTFHLQSGAWTEETTEDRQYTWRTDVSDVTTFLTNEVAAGTHFYEDAACTSELTKSVIEALLQTLQQTTTKTIYVNGGTTPAPAATTYTVRFLAGTGSGTQMADQEFTYGTAQNLTANTYTAPTATITYNYNGATGGNTTPSVTVNATFTGWSDGTNTYTDGQEVNNLTAEDGATINLTAQWEFDYDDCQVTIPTPEKAGYTFGGWQYEHEPGFVEDIDGGDIYYVSEDMTITAQWTPITYTITYNGLNGATNSNPETYNIESAAITLQDPGARDGFTFNGWTDDDNSNAAVTSIPQGSTGNRHFTANWTEVPAGTPHIDLYDDDAPKKDNVETDNATLLSSYPVGGTKSVDVTLHRKFTKNLWNTISLPFDFDTYGSVLNGKVFEMDKCTTSKDGMSISFQPVTWKEEKEAEMLAGQPYLVWTDTPIDEINFTGVQFKTFTADTTLAEPNGDVEFRAVFEDGYLTRKSSIFIGSGNHLYYAKQTSPGSRIRGYRGYFEIIKFNELEYTTPRVRIVINGEEVMSSEDNDTADIETRKYIEDGVLIIERGGVRYDAQGKRLE